MQTTRLVAPTLSTFAWYRFALRSLLIVAFAACIATSGLAQEYRTDPINDKARLHRLDVQGAVRNPAEYAPNKAKFDEFFLQYYFPLMTRSTSDGLAELGRHRSDLFGKYLRETSSEQLQSDLTKMAYDAMLKISANMVQLKPPQVADPPYHPAVRYNAILIIGMLDEKYAPNGTPKPYPAATKVMTLIVDGATTSNRFPPPVILGALIGLERHAQYRDTMDPATAAAMSTALLKFVNHDKPIQEMDRKAYAWLRLRAASALAKMGLVGQNNVAHDALIKQIGDFKSLDDRCETAALLAKLNYEGAKIDGKAALEAMFKLARDLGADETKRAEDFETMRATGTGPYALIPPSNSFTANDEEEYDPYPRRQVLARLLLLRTGLDALKKAVPDDDQKKIEAVKAAIKPVIDKAGDEKTITGRVLEAVKAMEPAIHEAPPAEAPAEEGELDL